MAFKLHISRTWRLAIFASLSGALMAFALGIYVCFSPAQLAPYLLYHGNKCRDYGPVPLTYGKVTGRQIYIPAEGGGRMAAYYFENKKAAYIVLLSHGQGRMNYHVGLAKCAIASGMSAFIYEYRGFGMSSGSPSTGGMMQDGLTAYDYLVNKLGYKPEQIIDMGSSLGTGVAANLALERKCAAVVLISPYTSINRVVYDYAPFFKIYPESLFPQPKLSCLPLFESDSKTPVLLLHGEKDQMINIKNSRELYNKARALPSETQEPSSKISMQCRFVEYPDKMHNLSLDDIGRDLKILLADLDAGKSKSALNQSLRSQKNPDVPSI